MTVVITVQFHEVGRMYYFDPGDQELKKGDHVIVETARGIEMGEVIRGNQALADELVKRPLKRMIRKANAEDRKSLVLKERKEAHAFRIAEAKIRAHELDMELVRALCAFDHSKITFYFTADRRVDFRALVRDLAMTLHSRIELRQISVRDQAKLLGGLGICGRALCCSLFTGDTGPVSIKMAQEQGMTPNPAKLSGSCGRLMCCLKYEKEAYADALKDMPEVGSMIDTPDGRGEIIEINVISQTVKVKHRERLDLPPVVYLFSKETGVTRKPVVPKEFALPELHILEAMEEQETPAPKPAPKPASKPAPQRSTAQKKQPAHPQRSSGTSRKKESFETRPAVARSLQEEEAQAPVREKIRPPQPPRPRNRNHAQRPRRATPNPGSSAKK